MLYCYQFSLSACYKMVLKLMVVKITERFSLILPWRYSIVFALLVLHEKLDGMKPDEVASKIEAHELSIFGEMEESSSKNLAFTVNTGNKKRTRPSHFLQAQVKKKHQVHIQFHFLRFLTTYFVLSWTWISSRCIFLGEQSCIFCVYINEWCYEVYIPLPQVFLSVYVSLPQVLWQPCHESGWVLLKTKSARRARTLNRNWVELQKDNVLEFLQSHLLPFFRRGATTAQGMIGWLTQTARCEVHVPTSILG